MNVPKENCQIFNELHDDLTFNTHLSDIVKKFRNNGYNTSNVLMEIEIVGELSMYRYQSKTIVVAD